MTLLFGGGDFPGGFGLTQKDNLDRPVGGVGAEVADILQVASVEGVRESKQGGEDEDDLLFGRGKPVKIDVFGAGVGAPMIAGDLGDDIDFGFGEALPGLSANQPCRDFVMTAAASTFRPADIVEAGGAFQEDPLFGAKPVEGAKFVEKSEGEEGDVTRVLRLGLEPFHGGAKFERGGDRIHQSSRRAANRSPRVLGCRADSLRFRSRAS